MIIAKTLLKKIYKKRKATSHKYDFGSLLVIGGSEKYSGSPGFNALTALAMAAYRTGTDIVEVAAPKRAADIIASFSPDIIAYPLKDGWLKKEHLNKLLELTKNKTAVVIGGGLERRKETKTTVLEFLKKINLPCVIDADAIYAVAGNTKVLKKNFVVTPHAYEFYILTKKKVEKLNLKQKIKIVKEQAAKLNITILLKGNVDIISDGKRVVINKTGSPYMTVGGTGDTLAGVLGSLLAQRINPFIAAGAAAYINGKAGELAAKKKKAALVASNLIPEITKIVSKLCG